MHTVRITEFKNRLSKYLALARAGEEVIIRSRRLPIARLVPICADGATEEELQLVAEGKLRLPERTLIVDELLKIPTGRVRGRAAIQAVLDERAEGY